MPVSSTRVAYLHLLKSAATIGVGKTVELPRSNVRVHRYRDVLMFWDLTNAGKRGKKVDTFSIGNIEHMDPEYQKVIEGFISNLFNWRSYADVRYAAKVVAEVHHDGTRENGYQPFGGMTPRIHDSQERGVDVAPAGFGPIRVDGEHVSIDAGWKSFSVRDKDDQFNLPTCIPSIKGGVKDIKVFYRWVTDNEAALKRMLYRDVLKGMDAAGIGYHSYCAMD